MNHRAIVSWNPVTCRYELHIDHKLKAYSDGHANEKEAHEEGKKALIDIAEEKGYEVEVRKE